MKLLYLKMKGFRKYKEPIEINLFDETYIIAGNAKGKSTIAYAIVWTFLGTDIRGNDKVSMINRDSKDCCTEIGFIGNDNEKHILEDKSNLKQLLKLFVKILNNHHHFPY